jgi:NADH-quinone oxidoreductase subunit N
MTVSFYILTAYLLNDERSSEAGLKYLILGAVSSAVMLFGISLIYALSGTTIIGEIAAKITTQPALIAGVVMLVPVLPLKSQPCLFIWGTGYLSGSTYSSHDLSGGWFQSSGFAALVRIFMMALPLSQFIGP